MSEHQANDHPHEDHGHDWFRHSAAEVAQDDHGSFNATMVLAVIFVTMAVVAVVILILTPHTKRELERLSVDRQERNEAAYLEFRSARTAWDAALQGEPVWINRAEGTMQIPFETAADEVIRRYANRR